MCIEEIEADELVNPEEREVSFIDTVSIVRGFVTSFDAVHASSLTRDIMLQKTLSDYLTARLSSLMGIL